MASEIVWGVTTLVLGILSAFNWKLTKAARYWAHLITIDHLEAIENILLPKRFENLREMLPDIVFILPFIILYNHGFYGIQYIVNLIGGFSLFAFILFPNHNSLCFFNLILGDLNRRMEGFYQSGKESQGQTIKEVISKLELSEKIYLNKKKRIVSDEEIIQAYGFVLEKMSVQGKMYASQDDLPRDLETIKNAIIRAAKITQAQSQNEKSLETLKVGYAHLADFLPQNEYIRVSQAQKFLLGDKSNPHLVIEALKAVNEITPKVTNHFRILMKEFEDKLLEDS